MVGLKGGEIMPIMVSREQIQQARLKYPINTRIELIGSYNPKSPPTGSKGTIQNISEKGTIFIKWDEYPQLNVDIFVNDNLRIIDK